MSSAARPGLRAAALLAGLITGLGAVAPPVCAQAFDTVRLYGPRDGGTFGGVLIAAHQYQGSDERRTLVLPVLDYQWASGWFAGVSNGIGVNLSDTPQLQYGPRLTVNLGRKESRSEVLRGMGDIDPAAEVGAFLNIALPQGPSLTSSLRLGSGTGRQGLLLDLGANWSTRLAPQWLLGTGSGLTLANAHYMQSFFGVNSAQSAASAHGVYTVDAGARDLRASLSLTHRIDPKFSVTAVLSVSHLLGPAQDSPLTRSRTSGSGVLALACAF
ncbi:MAG: hypothetical protein RIQ60_3108 [Pseudomonadota bacterium]|jgi:outer membrane scaffolding protein for murein synthesis (MipA/OmpV family)